MTPAHGRILAVLLSACAGLSLTLACKRPETVLRERPVQRLELVQKIQNLTPLEEKELVADLTEGLHLAEEPRSLQEGALRVLRIELEGRPDPNAARGLGKSMAVSTGTGILVGILLPGFAGTTWHTLRSAATAAGVGGVLGFAYGPAWHKSHQDLLKEMGYLPWVFKTSWTVLERHPERADTVLASTETYYWRHGAPALGLRPHLRPLPIEARTEADIRKASVQAYAKALVKYLNPREP